uniref:Uncharacterized protein n=1 Tax=Anguilla anguilla TaxID=7936 RepID=A0A0E9PZS2_ANGAN
MLVWQTLYTVILLCNKRILHSKMSIQLLNVLIRQLIDNIWSHKVTG